MANAPRLGHRLSATLCTSLPISLLVALGLFAVPVRGLQALPVGGAQLGAPAAAPAALVPATLDELIRLALGRQPAVAAARSSLAAAQVQSQALGNLGVAGRLSHELPIRRRQACLGVTIAAAAVTQAEWETVYAVTRNYYSVIFAREQEKVVKGLLDTLKGYRDTTESLVAKGNPDVQLTRGDVDKLAVTADLFQLRLIQAQKGAERALAALREALGVEPCYPILIVGDLPPLQEVPCRDELLALTLARRPELIQAATAAQVVELEVCAQGAAHGMTARTFAAASDIHARNVPQGSADGEYRPGAFGIEMPTTLAGRREDRMQRARELTGRAGAVVDKTRNLIALELADAYLKWSEAAEKLRALSGTRKLAVNVRAGVEARLTSGAVTGEDLIRGKTLEAQVLAQYNDALYQQALALTALERITAGGFCPGFRTGAILLGQ